MTDTDRLTILKHDLQMTTDASDDYLTTLLSLAAELVEREGAIIEDTTECNLLVCQYAAYLFRRRGSETTTMPRYLRWALNNLIFSQRAKGYE